jgi:uncharacterized protein (TIGR00288 family)
MSSGKKHPRTATLSVRPARPGRRGSLGVGLEERLQVAVFIDFDNIEIGVKTTLNTELDLSLVLEALKERGEVVSKSAYGDWARAGMHSRTLTDHAVHMVQRNVTPRGDKNGADINLVVDALEMAFTRPHITGFAIVGGDSDFIALVEKLKQFGKRVLVVGGRSFTSGVLQRNCHEFISYENLLSASRSGRGSQTQSRGAVSGRLPLGQGLEKVQRALKILADRGVEPQLGPLKSTLLQLDSTFSERDYGASSFREFIQRLDDQGQLHLRRIEQGYLVEMNGEGGSEPSPGRPSRSRSARGTVARAAAVGAGATSASAGAAGSEESAEAPPAPEPGSVAADDAASETPPPGVARRPEEAIDLLRAVVERVSESRAGKPMYVRHLAQGLRAADPGFDEQTYGFRTLTELVHLAQREGIVRMQRDRQGAWRITPAGTAPPQVTGLGPVDLASPPLGSPASERVGEADGTPLESSVGEAEVDGTSRDGEPVVALPVEAVSVLAEDAVRADGDAGVDPEAEAALPAPAKAPARRRRSAAPAARRAPRAAKPAGTAARTTRGRGRATKKKAPETSES